MMGILAEERFQLQDRDLSLLPINLLFKQPLLWTSHLHIPSGQYSTLSSVVKSKGVLYSVYGQGSQKLYNSSLKL